MSQLVEAVAIVISGTVGLITGGVEGAQKNVQATMLAFGDPAAIQAQEKGQTNPTVSTSGTTFQPGSDPGAGAGGNTPGATTGTGIVPSEQTVVNERADAANLAQVAYEQQGLTSIAGLKIQESRAESSIAAGAAARGLKLEGSPLYQLNAQKSAGATAIGSATTTFQLGDVAQREQNLAAYNTGILNMSNKNLQIQIDTSNQWLANFNDTIGMATSFLGKFWNPAQSMNNYNQSSSAGGGSYWDMGGY